MLAALVSVMCVGDSSKSKAEQGAVTPRCSQQVARSEQVIQAPLQTPRQADTTGIQCTGHPGTCVSAPPRPECRRSQHACTAGLTLPIFAHTCRERHGAVREQQGWQPTGQRRTRTLRNHVVLQDTQVTSGRPQRVPRQSPPSCARGSCLPLSCSRPELRPCWTRRARRRAGQQDPKP